MTACKSLQALLSITILLALQISSITPISTDSTHNVFNYGVFNLPHPAKSFKGGEDAHFANDNILAVADGVGAWDDYGVDPAKYSRALCGFIPILLAENEPYYQQDPKEIIREASIRSNTERGSSTFVILSLDKDEPILRTSYIGDSIYLIVRKVENEWKLIFEAKEMQVNFNFPYQLGPEGHEPELAEKITHEVQDKDLVIVASDGLFDNLTVEDIVDELVAYVDHQDELIDAKTAATSITMLAFINSLNDEFNSPFAQKATKAGRNFTGGKSDDITVLVGQINIKK